MNRYKIKYGRGYADDELPQEILADSFVRNGPTTEFFKDSGHNRVKLHSLATKIVVHIELIEENVDCE